MHKSSQILPIPVVILVLLMGLALSPVTAEDEAPPYCQRANRNCRLNTQWEDIDGYRFVSLNISCFCEDDEPEDVWDYLDALSRDVCSYLPADDGMKVNQSTIHITGCFVQKKVFPVSILSLARRTDKLEIVFNRCPYVRLGQITQQLRKVPLFQASFTDSQLSGLPRGWLAQAHILKAHIQRCNVSVVESKALSGFSQDADVRLEIINSNISTVKMLAITLPPLGRLTMSGGMVTTWDSQGYQGGSEIDINGVKFGRIMEGAFNLYGVTSFKMNGSVVAEFTAKALIDKEKATQRSSSSSSPGMDKREAVIIHNTFVKANGESFINLCEFSSIKWQNNTLVSIADAPLRLQDEKCKTKRNWQASVTVTGLSCVSCDDFATVDEQTCAFYQSGYCTSCKEEGDMCTSLLLPYLVKEKCPSSHPEVVSALKDVCRFDPDAPQPSARSFNTAHATSPVSAILITVVGLLVTCLVSY